MEFVVRTPDETRAFGAALGRLLKAGDVIALIGDLGMGKTTLAQGVAQGMGITESVTSPTFTLVQEYGRSLLLFHFDPYRLEQPEAMSDFGFEEYLERGGVVLVEWADKIAALLPPERLTLLMREGNGKEEEKRRKGEKETEQQEANATRLIEVKAKGMRYERLLAELAAQIAVE